MVCICGEALLTLCVLLSAVWQVDSIHLDCLKFFSLTRGQGKGRKGTRLLNVMKQKNQVGSIA